VTAILFVCLGNICRSPTAEAVFTRLRDEAGLTDRVHVDSCGTGDWHVGQPPDRRSVQAATARGYAMGHLRARQLTRADFTRFSHILAMDNANLKVLRALCPQDYPGTLQRLLDFAGQDTPDEVPDPYYGGTQGFDRVIDLVELGCQGLLEVLVRGRH